jgi:DNA-binding transcriptional ArsR family regulator
VFENKPLVNLALGRSSVRQRILALLLENGGARLHLREVQRRAATSPGTASRELARLVAAGLVEREPEGNQVYFRGSDSPAATLLLSLLTGTPLPTTPSPAERSGSRTDRRAVRTEAAAISPALPDLLPVTPEPVVAAPVAPPPASQAPTASGPERPVSRPRTRPPASPNRQLSMDSLSIQPATAQLPTVARPRPFAAVLGITPDPPARPTASPEAGGRNALSPAPPADSAPAVTPTPLPPRIMGPVTSPIGSPPPPAATSVQETRGRLAPRPEGLDLEIQIAAIRARGRVDDMAARAGATLAPNMRWLYGERLRAICLFGDRVNGRASPGSDVDLLIVLDRIERYGEELERTSLACASLSLELGVIVSRVFVAASEWDGGSVLKSQPALAGAVEL